MYVNIISEGLPKTAWKLKQQQGRVGRNGLPALDITLVFPQKGMIDIGGISRGVHHTFYSTRG